MNPLMTIEPVDLTEQPRQNDSRQVGTPSIANTLSTKVAIRVKHRTLGRNKLAFSLLAVWIALVFSPICQGDLALSSGFGNAKTMIQLNQVRELLRQNKLDEARKAAEVLNSSDPNLPVSDLLLAQLLVESGRHNDARRILEEFSLAQPDQFEVSLLFCRLAVLERRWFDGCVHAKNARTQPMPDAWSDKHKREMAMQLALLEGACCEGRRDWLSALTTYRAENTANGSSAQLILGLARAEFHLGNIDAAYQELLRVGDLEKESELPQVLLAQLFDSQGNASRAEHWYREAIASSDTRAESARLHFARFLIWNNRPGDVAPILAGKHATTEGEKERHYLAALVARMEGKFDTSQKILNALFDKEPNSFPIGNQLALVLVESVDEAQRGRAMQLAKANVRSHPKSADAWSTLGWVQFRLGDLEQAKKTLEVAASTGAISRDTAYFIAAVKEKSGLGSQANALRSTIASAVGPFYYRSQLALSHQ